MIIIVVVVVVIVRFCCTYGGLIRTKFGLQSNCCSGSSSGFIIVPFNTHHQTFESCHLPEKYLVGTGGKLW